MTKKVYAVMAVLFLSAAMETYAEFGIGVQGNGGFSGGGFGGASLLLSPAETLHFAVDWYLKGPVCMFGLTADKWLLNAPLTRLGPGDLKFFAGIGAYGRIGFGDAFPLGAGIRVPVGLDWRIQNIELFFGLAPVLDISILPEFDLDNLFGFSGAIGLRCWL